MLQFLLHCNLNNGKALQGFFGCCCYCGHSTQSVSVTVILISLLWFLICIERKRKSHSIYNNGRLLTFLQINSYFFSSMLLRVVLWFEVLVMCWKTEIVLYLPWVHSSFYSGLWTTNTVFRVAGKSMDCPLELYSVCVRAHVSECDDCHCQSFDLYIGNFVQEIIPPKKKLI